MVDSIGALTALCSELIGELDSGPAADDVRAVYEKLQEPLRVAIGGRLKAGKSTLVNALVGQRAAPVDVGECTKALYWYRYGDQPRIDVVPIEGARYELAFADGAVPSDLGRPPEAIDRVEVWLRVPALKDLVIIDTPGLETLNEQYAEITKEFLGIGTAEQQAVSRADVLVYLMTQPKSHDLTTLQSFRSAFPGAQLSALNAMGVLSRIDTLSGDDDPWPAARRHCATYAEKLRPVLSTITPVIGKLAETIECGGLTEGYFSDLVEIARLEPKTWAMMRRSADLFATLDQCEVPVERRDELLSLLGFYAAKQSVELIRTGACTSLSMLLEELRAQSGIDELRQIFAQSFSDRAAALKTGVAIAQLTSVYWNHRESYPELRNLLDRIDAVTMEHKSVMHQLQEAKIMRLIASGKLAFSEEHVAEIRRVIVETEPAARVGLAPGASDPDIAGAAAVREAEWNGVEQSARFSQQEIPRVIKQSYALLRESALVRESERLRQQPQRRQVEPLEPEPQR